MMYFAKNKKFEKAGEIKRQIFSLKHINDVALIKREVKNPFLEKNKELNENLLGNKNYRTEAYDIAHMSGKNMVGVMTVMSEGIPDKASYRKFKIKTQEKSNDVGALKEVLTRRFLHSEWAFPDLIVLDGSTAQINTANKIIREQKIVSSSGFPIEIVAVVKDERHKPLAIKGNESIIKERKNEILLANSEAHRFAINYHKNVRTKNFI